MYKDCIMGFIVLNGKMKLVGESVSRNEIYERTKYQATKQKANKYLLQFPNGKRMWFTK